VRPAVAVGPFDCGITPSVRVAVTSVADGRDCAERGQEMRNERSFSVVVPIVSRMLLSFMTNVAGRYLQGD
jgi:hypothetical protein